MISGIGGFLAIAKKFLAANEKTSSRLGIASKALFILTWTCLWKLKMKWKSSYKVTRPSFSKKKQPAPSMVIVASLSTLESSMKRFIMSLVAPPLAIAKVPTNFDEFPPPPLNNAYVSPAPCLNWLHFRNAIKFYRN